MKSILSSLAFFCFLLISCTKEKEPPASRFETSLETMTAATDIETKQQIYSEMSAQEKYEVWKPHFKHWLEKADIKSNPKKQQLIMDLVSTINAGTFEDDSQDQAIFLDYRLPEWLEKARLVFTEEEIFDFTMTNYVSPMQANLYTENVPDCFCHVGNSGYSCKKLSIGFPSGVSVDYGICESGPPCDYSRRGCGAFWLSSCNGGHCNF